MSEAVKSDAQDADAVWYIARDRQPYGPITDDEIGKLIELSHLRADDLVWRQGWAEWIAGEIVIAAVESGELQLGSTLGVVAAQPVEPAQGQEAAAAHVAPAVAAEAPPAPAVAPAARVAEAKPAEPALPVAAARTDAKVEPAPARKKSGRVARQAGFVRRHWRGELGLPTSLGISFFTVNALIGAVFYGLIIFVLRGSMPLLAAAFTALTALIVPVGLWQLVGVWRSAGRSLAHGRRIGPMLARGTMALALVGISALLVRNVQMTREFLRIAAGDGDLGRRSYDIVLGGRELIISGGISFGLADEVRRKLENNPQIRVIRLESSGGRVGPARELRNLIRERQLVTYTAQSCFSACAVAFLGGSERVIRDGARIGFHRPSFPGMRAHELTPEINVERGVMAGLGVPEAFINRAFSTPASEMWTPSPEELLAAHVVTRITQGTDFGIERPPVAELGRIETTLLENPLYAAIKIHAPATYAEMMQDVRAGLLQGMSPDHFAGVGLDYSAVLIGRNVASTSNEAILAYAKAELQLVRKLEARGAGYCYDSVFHVRRPPEAVAYRPSAGLLASLSTAAARVIEDAALRPSPAGTANSAAAQAGRKAVERVVAEKHGEGALHLLSGRAEGLAERTEACMLIGTVFESALALPVEQAGPFLREFLSEISPH